MPKGKFIILSKASQCLRNPKYVQERLVIMGIQKSCRNKRIVILKLKKKKAKLNIMLEQVVDPDEKEKIKHCIESISKKIDLKNQEERRDFKAGCKRAMTLNKFALKKEEVLVESLRNAEALSDDMGAIMKEHGFCHSMLQIMVKPFRKGKPAAILANDK